MNSRSLTVGRFFGIQLRIHYSWIIIFALVAWSVITGYIPIYAGMTLLLRIVLGLVVTLLFFVSVVCHEYAHSLVARSRGLTVNRITLFLFGGAAELQQEPTSAKTEFLMTIAGPLTSLLIALVSGVIWFFANAARLPLLVSIFEPLSLLNLTVGIFNLLPAYPLDGGRILRSAIWLRTKDIIRATKIASYASYGLSYVLMLLGVLGILSGNFLSGLWLGFLGYFLQRLTKVSLAQTISQKLLGSAKVADLMSDKFTAISPTTTVDVFLNNFVLGHGESNFLVGDAAGIIGIIELTRLTGPERAQTEASISKYMIPLTGAMKVSATDHVQHALSVMQSFGVHILPVYESSGPVGVITAGYIGDYVAIRGAGLKPKTP